MSLPEYSFEDYKKKRAAYLTAFDDFTSRLSSEADPIPAKGPAPNPTGSTRDEATYLRTDNLGCPLSCSRDSPDQEADDQEEEDLKVLAEKFGDKLPYLHKWLEDFRASRKTTKGKMPHHDSEENATGNLTDQVAKDSKDSTASDHNLHDVNTGAKEQASSSGKEGMKATVQHYHATPGPVRAQDLPPAASKEELKKRSEELNK